MNALDAVFVVGAVVAFVGGWRFGFLQRLAGWIGVALGAGVAVMTLPTVISFLGVADDSVNFIVGGMFLIGLVSIGQGAGFAIGSRLRSVIDLAGLRLVDALGGAVLGLMATLMIVWLMFPVMANAQGWPSRLARESTLTRTISEAMPPPPAQVDALVRQLAGGHFPTLFDRLTPTPAVEDPPADLDLDADVFRRSTASVVRITAPGCGHIQTGSGFVAAPGWVVTNAHVVAGSTETTVTTVDGVSVRSRVIHFDPATDLAVLAVRTDASPLPIAEPRAEDKGLVMGFPGGGRFDPSPFVVDHTLTARGRDIYDGAEVHRNLLVLGSELAPGDSGSAVLRSDGSVIGVAVAIAPDRPAVAYALHSNELQAVLEQVDPQPASTGPCR